MDTTSKLPLIVKNSEFIERIDEILTDEALSFIYKLENKFRNQRKLLLENRIKKQESIDQGNLPDFLSETKIIRE